jgi:hypothetical protein
MGYCYTKFESGRVHGSMKRKIPFLQKWYFSFHVLSAGIEPKAHIFKEQRDYKNVGS